MIRAMKTLARDAACAALAPMEARLLARLGDSAVPPPIFIVGAPRSGTSLVYEALVTRFRFAYFSNLAHRLPYAPTAASRLGRSVIRRWRGDFRSRFGHIEGWGAPNEGGWIWRRWIADGDWCDERAAADAPVAEMRHTVTAVSAVLDGPFLNKNVMHSNRMRLLDAIFPGCLFLEVRRDPMATARSIIDAQRREGGPALDAQHWWSVRPSTAPMHLGADMPTRAAAQVAGVALDIARDSAHVGEHRVMRIDYEKFCRAPETTMRQTRDFLAQRGTPLEDRAAAPDTFPLSDPRRLAAGEERQLEQALAALWPGDLAA